MEKVNIVERILAILFVVGFVFIMGVIGSQEVKDWIMLDEYEKKQQEEVYPKVQEKLDKILEEQEKINKKLPN